MEQNKKFFKKANATGRIAYKLDRINCDIPYEIYESDAMRLLRSDKVGARAKVFVENNRLFNVE